MWRRMLAGRINGFWAPDEGGGAAGVAPAPAPPATPPATVPTAPPTPPATPPAPPAPPPASFTQADLDRVRAEEKTRHEQAVKDAEAERNRKAAEEQGQFKQLYEAEQAKAVELQKTADQAAAYRDRLNSQIDAETKEWPASLKKMDPGPANLEVRLGWIDSARAVAKELVTARQAPVQEHGAGGGPVGGTVGENPVDAYVTNRYRRQFTAPNGEERRSGTR